MSSGASLSDPPQLQERGVGVWSMRTGTKNVDIHSKSPGFPELPRADKAVLTGCKDVTKEERPDERTVEKTEQGVSEKNQVIVLSNSSSSQSQSSGYNSSGTPTPSNVSAASVKAVTVLKPNRQSSEKETTPVLARPDHHAPVADVWRKQGLGSALPAIKKDAIPNGDEGSFPALPTKQSPSQERKTASPTLLTASSTQSTAAPSLTTSAAKAGTPNGPALYAASPSPAPVSVSPSPVIMAAKTTPGTTTSAPGTPTTMLVAAPTDYAKKLVPIPQMTECVKIIDETFHWRGDDPLLLNRCGALLDSNSDYLVVGVVGSQGAGKSTLLNYLAGGRGRSGDEKPVFRLQSDEVTATGSHQTSGVDMYITSALGGGGGERLILLDTQPVFSVSALDNLVHYDRKYPPDFATAENCVVMQSLHLLSWLMTTCHIILVVQDWFVDLELVKHLLTAEMLKPSLSPVVADGNLREEEKSTPTPSSNEATLVFVQTKATPEEMTRTCYAQMQRALACIFAETSLNLRGDARPAASAHHVPGGAASGKRISCVDPDGGDKDKSFSDINLYLLPDLAPDQFSPSGLTQGLSPSMSSDYAQEVKVLKRKLLGLRHRPALFGSGSKGNAPGSIIGEKMWLRQAGKVWEGMKKASLMLEYNRLLT